MPEVMVTESIAADPEAVFVAIADMAQFPQFMPSVESLRILERGDGYTVTEWVARLKGNRFRWVERDTFHPDEGTIRFDQIEGDLKVFRGEWRVSASTGQETTVTLRTEFEFGIPMLASLLNPLARLALRDNARAMIHALSDRLASRSDDATR